MDADRSATADMAVEMKGICKSFFGVRVLQAVDFDVRRGEVHVLLGENGAGKSTLMKILSAAYTKDEGQILIGGQEMDFSHPREAQEAGISTVYQTFNLAPHLNVAENIYLGRMPIRMGLVDWSEMYRGTRAALDLVQADINPRARVSDLSIAARQMVEIAGALSRKANVIIMDEPTSALTDREVERLFEIIRSLTAGGVSVIYISHRLEELQQLGDRVTVLRDGRKIGTRLVSEVDASTLVRMMVGRDIERTVVTKSLEGREEALRVEGLSRKRVLHDISFSAYRGEILGIAGLMGSGRTELAQAIFGARPPDEGKIYVKGKEVGIEQPADGTALGLGFLTEDRAETGLALSMSVKANMTMAFWAGVRQWLRNLFLSHRQEQLMANQYRDDLDIRTRSLDEQVKYLSGGNQQKVVLAKWLMAQCDILLLDEPTLGIDVGTKEEVHRLIVQFTREEGGTVIMISSDLPEILKLSDRILVMCEGHLTGQLTRQEATEEKIMLYAVGVQTPVKAGERVSPTS